MPSRLPTRLLFVCLGNICRSPSAENIMNHLIKQQQLTDRIVCDSAGTSSYHIGSEPNPRMAAAAQKKGITLEGSARQFTKADFQNFDVILAMDRSNYQDILSVADADSEALGAQQKVKLMCDFCRNHDDREVPDPYYGGEAGFDYVIELLTDACGGLLEAVEADLI